MAREIFAQLFLDLGKGYNEEDSIRKDICYGPVELEFDVSSYKSIENIRFDPANIPCVISDLKITYKFADSEKDVHYYLLSEGNTENKYLIFYNPDPMLGLEWIDGKAVKSIQVQFYLADTADILSELRGLICTNMDSSLESRLDELRKLLKSVNSKVSNFEGEINFQQSQVGKIYRNVQSLSNIEEAGEKLLGMFEGTPVIQEIHNLEQVKSRLAITEEKLGNKNAQLNDLKAIIADQKKKISAMEKELATTQKNKDKLAVNIAVLKKDKTAFNRKIKSLEKQKDKLNTENIRAGALLNAKKDEMAARIEADRTELNILKEEKNNLNSCLKELNTTREKYEKLLSELDFVVQEI